MRIFTGYDPREALGTWVFQHSVLIRTRSAPTFTNLWSTNSAGTNAFTYERFRAPSHAGYRGPPILFCDGADMVCLAQIEDIMESYQPGTAVQVVKRPDYVATTPKYIGTEMEAPNKSYPRKNWSSVMLMAPGHFAWQRVKWGYADPAYWAEFGWLKDNELGELPSEWNRVVDEGDPVMGGKILHWTLGIPGISAYAKSPGAELWFEELASAVRVPRRAVTSAGDLS